MFGRRKHIEDDLDEIIVLLQKILAARQGKDIKTLGVTIDPPVKQEGETNG